MIAFVIAVLLCMVTYTWTLLGAHMPAWFHTWLIGYVNSTIASRKPDFVIGADYLRRWWIVKRDWILCVYVHMTLHDDEDRALHDHRSFTISFVLETGYWEIVPQGSMKTWRERGMPTIAIWRAPGTVVFRSPWQLHRLRLARTMYGRNAPPMTTGELPGMTGPIPAKTLFITLPHMRGWGFACPQRWIPWREFTSPADVGQVGKGCGD